MTPGEICNKKVLLSPLNWGIGHVSRSIGIIYQLLEQGNEIVIAADAHQRSIFQEYFPNCIYVAHEGYPFDFGGKGNFAWDLTKRLGALKARLQQERWETETLVEKFGIELVLSDHRYGFCSENVPSIFVTHQYHLPVSGWQLISDSWHKKRMRPFQHIWILDYEGNLLSGKLTENISDKRVVFVGPYSRFSKYDSLPEKAQEVVVVSGPHVYAQQFADAIAKKYPSAVFVCSKNIELDERIKRISGSWSEQDAAIMKAKRLISRSGYSTIMDLEVLKISAELYPTPGQAEQLYLHQKLTDCSEYIPLVLRDRSCE